MDSGHFYLMLPYLLDVRHKRQISIYLAKRETTVFNREIAAEAGEISSSGVSHQYLSADRQARGYYSD